MIPEIDPKVMLWKTDLLRQTISKMNLNHFLPRKTPKDNMVRNTNRKDLLNCMHSFHTSPHYGEIPLHGNITNSNNTGSINLLKKQAGGPHKTIQPRDDHIVLVNKQQEDG